MRIKLYRQVIYKGNVYKCKQYLYLEGGEQGVSIHYMTDQCCGIIKDLVLPDSENIEETKLFDEEVYKYLDSVQDKLR